MKTYGERLDEFQIEFEQRAEAESWSHERCQQVQDTINAIRERLGRVGALHLGMGAESDLGLPSLDGVT